MLGYISAVAAAAAQATAEKATEAAAEPSHKRLRFLNRWQSLARRQHTSQAGLAYKRSWPSSPQSVEPATLFQGGIGSQQAQQQRAVAATDATNYAAREPRGVLKGHIRTSYYYCTYSASATADAEAETATCNW